MVGIAGSAGVPFRLGGGPAAKLTVYSRQHCHLCDDMLVALNRLRDEFDFEVDVCDIDADPALREKFNVLVPVLEADGREICRYVLDPAAVRKYLSERG